jgi:hypothetical protein
MTIPALNNLVTVEQLIKKYPQLTIGGVRWWLFHRKTNNLQNSKSIIKIGRKIFIDEPRFIDWLYKNKVQ